MNLTSYHAKYFAYELTRKIQIKPHPGDLKWAKIKHPTIRGSVEVDFENEADFFKMNITIPPNTHSEVYIPLNFEDYTLT